MIDLWTLVSQFVNLPATIAAAAIAWYAQRMLPSPEGEVNRTVPGSIGARLIPFVAPFVALVFCLSLERKTGINATTFVRGIISGFAAEYLLRVTFKTVLGK
jgi:hypothetical protein